MTTSIEWTHRPGTVGVSWNPTRGCRKISAGCKHCYAETFAERWRGTPGHPYEQGFDPRLVPHKLAEPLRWRKPSTVFVNSMSDLFLDEFPFEYIAAIWGVMAATPQHTYLVLTKRPERAREFFAWVDARAGELKREWWCQGHASETLHRDGRRVPDALRRAGHLSGWPLPNVWLGVSVEDQQRADERIPLLLQCPAAVRFLSCEPLLGPVDLRRYLEPSKWMECCGHPAADGECCGNGETVEGPAIRWVIAGGESGPGARPFNIEWARSIVGQCRAGGVACFVKQLGSRPLMDTEVWSDGGRFVIGHVSRRLPLEDRKGGDMDEWPADLCVRQFPEVRP